MGVLETLGCIHGVFMHDPSKVVVGHGVGEVVWWCVLAIVLVGFAVVGVRSCLLPETGVGPFFVALADLPDVAVAPC